MNGWLFFPTNEILNHDFAIRRFCPARMEEEQRSDQRDYQETSLIINQINHLYSFSPFDDPNHDLPASEVDDFVDSFINLEDHNHQQIKPINDLSIKTTDQDDDTFLDVNILMDDDEEMMMANGSSVDMRPDQASRAQEVVNHGCVLVNQGLHLVHMLLACAEAVGCRDTQLANSILTQIWSYTNPSGDSLQRVSYCFATGLKSRLSLLQTVNSNGTFNKNGDFKSLMITKEEKMEAFHLLYQTTPYIAFGFMAANEAICEAAQGKEFLHIIDIGMEHTLQWPSLIRTLASRHGGPPKKLRITGLSDDKNMFANLENNMKSLIEDASLLGIPLEFCILAEAATPFVLTRENLNLKEGETLFVNTIMHLHKYVKESRGSLKAILQAIKKLNPTLVSVVEQDGNHNGPFFLGRFLESLHYYSAIFDSLEASFPRNNTQRMKIERFHFADEIQNIVAFEGSDRIERHERADQWRRQLGRVGFRVMGLNCLSQARMMLSVYGCDGYSLSSEKGCLLLGWKGRPIMLASAWQLHNNVSSS